MINHYTQPVRKNSSAVVEVVFKDENKVISVPNSVTWSLTKEDGTEINSRTNVSVTPGQTSTRILLQGNDLQLFANDSGLRYMIINATYNSVDGLNIPWKATISFYVTS